MGMDVSCKIVVGVKVEEVELAYEADDLPEGWTCEWYAPEYPAFKDDDMWVIDSYDTSENFYGFEIETVDCFRNPDVFSHSPQEIINRIEHAVARFKNLYNLEPKMWFVPVVS